MTQPLRPPAAPPNPAQRAGWVVLVTGAVSLVLAVVMFPLGLALGIGALLAGRRVARAARANGWPTPATAAAGMALGGVGSGLALLVLAVVVVLWPQVRDYTDCRAGATTRIAQQACDDALGDAVLDRLRP